MPSGQQYQSWYGQHPPGHSVPSSHCLLAPILASATFLATNGQSAAVAAQYMPSGQQYQSWYGQHPPGHSVPSSHCLLAPILASACFFATNGQSAVHFDGDRPVDLTAKMTHDGDHVTKVAILVLPSHMITVDTRTVGKYLISNCEELEMQGWKVVTINPYMWNSLQLGSDSRKKDYLWKEIKSILNQEQTIQNENILN